MAGVGGRRRDTENNALPGEHRPGSAIAGQQRRTVGGVARSWMTPVTGSANDAHKVMVAKDTGLGKLVLM